MSNSNHDESLTGLFAGGESRAAGIGAATPAVADAAAICSCPVFKCSLTVGPLPLDMVDTFDGGLAAVSASYTAAGGTAACVLTTLSPGVVTEDVSSGMVKPSQENSCKRSLEVDGNKC